MAVLTIDLNGYTIKKEYIIFSMYTVTIRENKSWLTRLFLNICCCKLR